MLILIQSVQQGLLDMLHVENSKADQATPAGSHIFLKTPVFLSFSGEIIFTKSQRQMLKVVPITINWSLKRSCLKDPPQKDVSQAYNLCYAAALPICVFHIDHHSVF